MFPNEPYPSYSPIYARYGAFYDNPEFRIAYANYTNSSILTKKVSKPVPTRELKQVTPDFNTGITEAADISSDVRALVNDLPSVSLTSYVDFARAVALHIANTDTARASARYFKADIEPDKIVISRRTKVVANTGFNPEYEFQPVLTILFVSAPVRYTLTVHKADTWGNWVAAEES